MTAASTQVLGSTPALGAPTTVLNQNPTKPAYLPADSNSEAGGSAKAAVAVASPKPQRSKLPVVIIVLILLMSGAVVCFFVLQSKPQGRGPQQTVESNSGQPGTYNSPTGIPQNLIYPGSKPGMSVSRQNRTIAQYETTDPIGKVIDWYKYKMKVTDLKITSGGQQAVLTLDKSTVNLTSSGKVTNITITQER